LGAFGAGASAGADAEVAGPASRPSAVERAGQSGLGAVGARRVFSEHFAGLERSLVRSPRLVDGGRVKEYVGAFAARLRGGRVAVSSVPLATDAESAHLPSRGYGRRPCAVGDGC
jgi:hypothetical protein